MIYTTPPADNEDDPQRLWAEIHQLRAQLAAVDRWERYGEQLIARGASYNVLFRLGGWWADRPWRQTRID